MNSNKFLFKSGFSGLNEFPCKNNIYIYKSFRKKNSIHEIFYELTKKFVPLSSESLYLIYLFKDTYYQPSPIPPLRTRISKNPYLFSTFITISHFPCLSPHFLPHFCCKISTTDQILHSRCVLSPDILVKTPHLLTSPPLQHLSRFTHFTHSLSSFEYLQRVSPP